MTRYHINKYNKAAMVTGSFYNTNKFYHRISVCVQLYTAYEQGRPVWHIFLENMLYIKKHYMEYTLHESKSQCVWHIATNLHISKCLVYAFSFVYKSENND